MLPRLADRAGRCPVTGPDQSQFSRASGSPQNAITRTFRRLGDARNDTAPATKCLADTIQVSARSTRGG